MGTPKEPTPVKLFIALLSRQDDLFPLVEKDLAALLGPTDTASGNFRWDVSRYYESEMGAGLLRRFVSFFPLVSPEPLAEIKLKTQELERDYQWTEGERSGRRINIDPGYLDAGKIVLASTKYAAHRIYLRSGIYGEVTLLFRSGSFHPFPHTYADYLWPQTLSFFAALRALYLAQLQQGFSTSALEASRLKGR